MGRIVPKASTRREREGGGVDIRKSIFYIMRQYLSKKRKVKLAPRKLDSGLIKKCLLSVSPVALI